MTQEKTMRKQMKEKKQSKGPAGMTEKELKDLKSKKKFISTVTRRALRRSAENQADDEFKMPDKDDMSMPILNLSKEQLLKRAMDSLLAKGGEVKKYRGGGSVHNNKKQYGTQGYRAARKPK